MYQVFNKLLTKKEGTTFVRALLLYKKRVISYKIKVNIQRKL